MKKDVTIKSDECIGCGTCVDICPKVFEFDESETIARVKKQGRIADSCIDEAIESCPAQCISRSTGEYAECDACTILCSDVFAFNENEDMIELMLPQGDVNDCVEAHFESCVKESTDWDDD